ncbi:hypothetical protein Hanom_Chr02g00152831 [Helianthus anomalus]
MKLFRLLRHFNHHLIFFLFYFLQNPFAFSKDRPDGVQLSISRQCRWRNWEVHWRPSSGRVHRF